MYQSLIRPLFTCILFHFFECLLKKLRKKNNANLLHSPSKKVNVIVIVVPTYFLLIIKFTLPAIARSTLPIFELSCLKNGKSLGLNLLL